jgi:hypothetical protein
MSVLPVFEGDGWNYIRDHVHFNLGRWYVVLKKSDLAIQHLMRLLACNHQSALTQEMFLGDFLRVFQSVGKKDEMFKLKLPVINMTSLRIHFEDHRTYASPAAINEFMQDLSVNNIIPYMEQKIRSLNQQVSAIRKAPGKLEHKCHSFPIFQAVVGASILQLPANLNKFQMSSSKYQI